MGDVTSDAQGEKTRSEALWESGRIEALEVWFGCEGSERSCVLMYPKGALSSLSSPEGRQKWALAYGERFSDSSLATLRAPISEGREPGRRWASVAIEPPSGGHQDAKAWAMERLSPGPEEWEPEGLALRFDALDAMAGAVSYRMACDEGSQPLPLRDIAGMMGEWSRFDEADTGMIKGERWSVFVARAEANAQAEELEKAAGAGARAPRARI